MYVKQRPAPPLARTRIGATPALGCCFDQLGPPDLVAEHRPIERKKGSQVPLKQTVQRGDKVGNLFTPTFDSNNKGRAVVSHYDLVPLGSLSPPSDTSLTQREGGSELRVRRSFRSLHSDAALPTPWLQPHLCQDEQPPNFCQDQRPKKEVRSLALG